MKNQKFEHKKLCIASDYVEKNLGKMEREGWELVSAINSTTSTDSIMLIWKRPCRTVIRPDKY